MFISIVLPTHNEGQALRRNLLAIEDFFRSQNWDFEIIVSDDGSTDETLAVAKSVSEGKKEYKIIENPKEGIGFAVKSGVLAAAGDCILYKEPNLPVPVEELKKLFVWVKDQEFKAVFGVREGVGAKRVGQNPLSRLFDHLVSLLVRLLLVKGFTDATCFFRLFERETARRIFSLVKASDESFDLEVLFLARKLGILVKEAPVEWHAEFSKISRATFLLDILKIRLANIRGKYPLENLKPPPPPQEDARLLKGLSGLKAAGRRIFRRQ